MESQLPGVARALLPRTPGRALAWYIALTLAMTWPLASVVTTRLPNDFGDPVLNCWILAWNIDHFLRALGGQPDALASLWHGNIFHPERYTLGYSELMIAQSLQALPVQAATGNIILSYNLLFLSTFFLSALGMFLLVRALVHDWRVAFVAGLLYGFMPYRVQQASHLQVMTTQWMPFALYGFHQAIATRRLAPLAGGALALLAQNLSCGYFLLFFSLFVPPFVVAELWHHARLRDLRLWAGFVIAGVAVGAATLPFMQPYLALRSLVDTRRSLEELAIFSADTWSWLTTQPGTTVLSPWLRLMDKPEGALFPGVLPIVLAGIALVFAARRTLAATATASQPARTGVATFLAQRPALARGATWFGGVLVVWGVVTTLFLMTGAGGLYRIAGVRIRIQSLTRSLEFVALGLLVLMPALPVVRAIAGRIVRSPLAFFAGCFLLAAYLSLGPDVKAGGDQINGPPFYIWLYEFVPGFDGLRVPARFAAVAGVFLTIVASWGLRDVLRRSARPGAIVVAASLFWLAETSVVPFPIARVPAADTPDVLAPPADLPGPGIVPAIYERVRQLPADAVLLELPIGDISWELRYMFASTRHWRPMVNGYSGYAPASYLEMVNGLRNPLRDPDLAWQRLSASTVTHVVVHHDAYYPKGIPRPDEWLAGRGATLIARTGTASLYGVR